MIIASPRSVGFVPLSLAFTASAKVGRKGTFDHPETVIKNRLLYSLLLLSNDEAIAGLVSANVESPWQLLHQSTAEPLRREMFALPNVRLVILDDAAVRQLDRSWLLAQIRKHFFGQPLIYVADSYSEDNERLARANGAQYYLSKPFSDDRFVHVLRSFLDARRFRGQFGPGA